MLALLAPILVFGLVVFVHELGHFLAAKATGVYAPRFSIGFGPALWRWRPGETEYVLAALPLGGYVRMASRHDQETAFLEGGNEEKAPDANDPRYDPEAMIPFGPKPVPEDRWFESKSLPARLLIMIAGVVMNAVLAVVVAAALAHHYGRVIYPSTVVGAVKPVADAPALANLHAGDTIGAVNGKRVTNWGDVMQGVIESRQVVTFTTQHGDVRVPVGGTPGGAQQVAQAIVYYIPPVIDSVVPGDRAAKAGFQRGDSIVAVNGASVRSWTDMVAVVSTSAGKLVSFAVARGSRIDTLQAIPRVTTEVDSATGKATTVGKIGAAAKDYTRIEPVGLVESVTSGFRITWGLAGSVVGVVHDLFAGKTSVKQLGGPVAITRAAVTAAEHGIDQLFYLIALLSINVAVLNLLPIPILDGGQILINVVEAAKGKPFSLRTREYILRFGLLAIALLFAVVMYNDTRAGFARLFGWVARLVGLGT